MPLIGASSVPASTRGHRQLVLIVVNARTQSEDQLSRKEKPPGFFTVAEKTATVAMDNYSYDSVTKLREALYARVQTQKDEQACVALLSQIVPRPPSLSLLQPISIRT